MVAKQLQDPLWRFGHLSNVGVMNKNSQDLNAAVNLLIQNKVYLQKNKKEHKQMPQ